MPRRRGDGHRFIRWLWTSAQPGARLARAALVPASGLWRAGMSVRSLAFRRGWIATRELPLPSIAIGNLTVGGSGKTPIAGWVAAHYLARGHHPAILLRGVGGDETLVHREALPGVVVVPNPDRHAGANEALLLGADVLVLDDAYQRLDVARDFNICVVSAETRRAVRWPLPAGPWREGPASLARADALIVTRKRADFATAQAVADEFGPLVAGPVAIVHLGLSVLRGLVSGTERPVASLAGTRVVAASAIADPDAFVAQLKRTGAQVQVATWKDHHQFRDEDVAWLAHAVRRADHVVMTAKDAVKLRHRWPASVPEPLVATLSVTFESGEDTLREALDLVVARGS
ncbi:MAG: tetraacyldisaccharide 4'-kinase [Gemmatimonadota bacterium]